MITTYSHCALEHHSTTDYKALLSEPFLVLGSAAFWLMALPFAAITLFCVKICETVTGVCRRRSNPLILRRGKDAELVLSRQSTARQA